MECLESMAANGQSDDLGTNVWTREPRRGRWVLAIGLLAATAVSAPQAVRAGGIYAGEFATPSMGTAGAGSTAIASGAATAIHNPAGMTRLDEHQVHTGIAPGVSVVSFDPDSSTTIAGSDGGQQGGFLPLSSGAYVHELAERWRLGTALFSLSGAGLDPHDDWVGRNQLAKVKIFTLSFAPTVAYRVTDWLSVAAGPVVTYGRLDQTVIAPGPLGSKIKVDDADDFAVSASVSGLVEITPELRVGVAYMSEIDLNLDGDLTLGGLSPSIDLDMHLPQSINWDVFWQATDEIELMVGGNWEDWSRFGRLPLSLGPINQTADLHFQDTFKGKAGIHYRLDEDWLLQAGFAYDTSAIKHARHRTAVLPVDQQFRYTLGTLYDYSKDTTLGFGVEFADLGKARIRNSAFQGDYDRNFMLLLNFTANWKGLPWKNRGTF